MITISQAVEALIKKSPYLEEALSFGILNLSALARLLKPQIKTELGKDVQEGAIIMALRRLSLKMQKRREKAQKIFRKAPDLMVRSNLIEMTFANSEGLIQKEKKLLDQISPRQNVFLTFTQGIYETTIIASLELKEKMLNIFKGEKLISKFERLSSLTVELPQGTAMIPGAYNFILKSLAWEGVNVIEVVSTLNEFTIILEDRTIDQAFSIIKRLF